MQDSVLVEGDAGELATSALKVPPHSIDAEQSVLGGLMLDNPSWDHIVDRVGRLSGTLYPKSSADRPILL